MYWKHKYYSYLFCVLIIAMPVCSKSFIDTLRNIFSFTIPANVFATVNESIVGKLQAKNIKFVLPNRIEIDDIEVLDEKGNRVLFGKHVSAVVSLLSLLTSNIRITDSHVEGAFFDYRIAHGIHNIISSFNAPPKVVKAHSTDAKTRVTIEKVTVENGRYHMHHDAGVTIDAEGIFARGGFFIENGRFNIEIAQVAIAKGLIVAAGMEFPLADLKAYELFISNEVVATKSLTATYEKSSLKAQGSVFIAEERYDLDAFIDAPKNTYPRGLKPLPFEAPAFKAKVKMLGSLTQPQFITDATFLDTSFQGLAIRSGSAHARIDLHQVAVDKAQIALVSGGEISAQGKVDIDSGLYEFSTNLNFLASSLAQFLALKHPVEGKIIADGALSGDFRKKEQALRLVYKGSIEEGKIAPVTLPDKTNFDVDLNLIFDRKLEFTRLNLHNHKMKLASFGSFDFPNKALILSFDVAVDNLASYYPLPEGVDHAAGLSARGMLTYKNDQFTTQSKAFAGSLGAKGFTITNVEAMVAFAKDQLEIKDVSFSAYQGRGFANLVLNDVGKKNLIKGEVLVENVELYQPTRVLSDFIIQGHLSSTLTIGGSLADPQVSFLAEVDDPVLDKAVLKSAQIEGRFADNKLSIERLSAVTKSGTIESNNLFFDMSQKKMAGTFLVNELSLASVLSPYSAHIDGIVEGPIELAGTFSSPSINAPLIAKNFQMFSLPLGNGPLHLAFEKKPTAAVVSVSTNFLYENSLSIARLALDLSTKTINADINFDDLNLNTARLQLLSNTLGIQAKVSGNITAEGPLSSPQLTGSILAKEYGFFDPSMPTEVQQSHKLHGPALIFAQLKEGRLALDACASFLDPKAGLACTSDSSVILSVNGPLTSDAFTLDVKGSVDHAHMEELTFLFKNELLALSMGARFQGQVTKKPKTDLDYRFNVEVRTLQAQLPNVPVVTLKKPINLVVAHNAVSLKDDAVLLFSPGELLLRGSFAKEVNLYAEGTLPLMLLRFFVPIVQRADGLARGRIALRGKPDAIMLEGHVSPDTGSLITLKKWLEPIEVKDGAITFTKINKNSFKTKFDKIKLNIGDGKLTLNGSLNKQYDAINHFDLDLLGNGIVFRDGFNFIETDIAIKTAKDAAGTPIAQGDIIITDGSAYQQFDLRNFVAQAKTTKSQSLIKTLESINLLLNLDIAVRQFRASARMLNLDIDTNLRGQMTVVGPLAHPKFKGALSINDGGIAFPSTTFPFIENQIPLDEVSPRPFDPKIDIVTTQELDVETYAPHIAEDTTVELSLKGDIDRLSLSLRPISGEMRLSQLAIFLLLMSPMSSSPVEDQLEMFKRRAQSAAFALSGEVFLRPLTNELQELLEKHTKTRIQLGSALDPGGVTLRLNWKLGPRVEIQGSYMFLNEETRRIGSDKPSFLMDASYPLGDLKIKLLLFDHRPWGPLSLEGSFGSVKKQYEGIQEPRGKVRLKYRVLTK